MTINGPFLTRMGFRVLTLLAFGMVISQVIPFSP